MSARLIQVIETDLERRGSGEGGSPIRRVTQYYSTDGKLLAEVDAWAEGMRIGDEELVRYHVEPWRKRVDALVLEVARLAEIAKRLADGKKVRSSDTDARIPEGIELAEKPSEPSEPFEIPPPPPEPENFETKADDDGGELPEEPPNFSGPMF